MLLMLFVDAIPGAVATLTVAAIVGIGSLFAMRENQREAFRRIKRLEDTSVSRAEYTQALGNINETLKRIENRLDAVLDGRTNAN